LKTMHGLIRGEAPSLDLAREAALQRVLVEGAANGIVRSAHDCAEGGLAVTIAESCFDSSLGVEVELKSVRTLEAWRTVATLFGESASRAVVSVSPEHVDRLLAMAAAVNLPAARIGIVGGDRIRVSVDGGRIVDESLATAELIWSTAIENYFERVRAVA
jgi:phosphoribosylformylglycinamidine (FGAM) synthase-like enzyme